ncbi:MAG: ATP-dependent sacrificial sulfur transferase LarE, partial [Defluviitaleaceae bacterium]|nr:ATP-dependent sacrificial sulfur transferase LarE [Defluviitaleaceae bacterium]
KHIVFDFDPFSVQGFSDNPPNRCYDCKRAIMTKIISIAQSFGTQNVLEGSHTDDLNDYRAGAKAVKELGVLSLFQTVGISKNEIRMFSKERGLPTWQKPSFACLASRFVHGEQITAEKLRMVEQAEELLHEIGFAQVRVRLHGNLARIETQHEDIKKIPEPEVRSIICEKFKLLGFSYVSLDLNGYRTGSMNVF